MDDTPGRGPQGTGLSRRDFLRGSGVAAAATALAQAPLLEAEQDKKGGKTGTQAIGPGPVKLTLASEDVIHDFFVPAFRTKIDVIPGRYVQTWFQATKVGRYHLFCSQYCGTSHANMVGTVVVMERDDYREWLDSRAEGSLALQGRKLFLKLECLTCHSADAKARAPVLEDLYLSRVTLSDGRSVVANDAYLRESILQPRAKVAQGWQPLMPTFQGQVSEEELIQLIAYLRSLRRNETPVRNEDFPPPVGAPTTVDERKEREKKGGTP